MFLSVSRHLIPGKVLCHEFLKEILSRALTVYSADNPEPIKEAPPETLFIKDLQKSQCSEFKMKRVMISEQFLNNSIFSERQNISPQNTMEQHLKRYLGRSFSPLNNFRINTFLQGYFKGLQHLIGNRVRHISLF